MKSQTDKNKERQKSNLVQNIDNQKFHISITWFVDACNSLLSFCKELDLENIRTIILSKIFLWLLGFNFTYLCVVYDYVLFKSNDETKTQLNFLLVVWIKTETMSQYHILQNKKMEKWKLCQIYLNTKLLLI